MLSKSFQDDWGQVNNRQTFTDGHLLISINSQVYEFSFVYTFSQGRFDHRSYDQIILMRMYKEIRKLHLKLDLKKILSKTYVKS